MERGRIAIVGCGLVGRGWAITFARAGHEAALFDPAEGAAEAARARIATALDDLAAVGLLEGQTAGDVLARIGVAPGLEAALEGAVHVQESAPEVLEVKRALYLDLDRIALPETVLASSTSGFVASSFTDHLDGRARCLVNHPLNPPFLIPCVEICPAPWTDAAVVERTRALMEGIGQSPIVMTRELDGFIVNRLQAALVEEAFRLVEGGYASAGEVDRAVSEGLGLRWSFMGPFETGDLNAQGGIRAYAKLYQHVFHRLAQPQPQADWLETLDRGVEAEMRARVPLDRLGERSLWRDRRLMALAVHKRQQER
jgi:L-gulonate 3-dehydrogenase